MNRRDASVLLVEDSETQALALRGLLEAEGYSVAWADSGESALEMLNQTLPDLVVADFHLPGMDGRELSRQIRMNGRTRTLPVLMLTGARELDLEQQGLESGADAYVAKSADPEVVLLRLRALLRSGGRVDEAVEGRQFQPFRRARLLLIHESPTVMLRLRHVLTHDGYDVLTARGDQEALSVSGDEVDCVLVPVSSARLEGLALCHELNERRTRMASPYQILAMGADGDPEALHSAFAAGADEVAPSEAGEDTLRVRIRALVRRKLLADDNRRAEAELRERELAVAEAKAEAATAEARAAAADALARANAELETANRQLRNAQAQLVQAAKMASLGELVAGIAHEINNPLAFILGHQETVERLSRQTLEAVEPGSEAAALMAKAADRLGAMRMGLKRIQALVMNLRKFSRLDEGDRQLLDVRDAIETVIALLSPKLGRIEVRRTYDAERPLEGSPALLNQVVMNIVSNAADALEGEGVIQVVTRDAAEGYQIEISDSGPGIPDGIRDRIFEPFFTTKPVGSGTGLGLAIAYRVVQAHDGAIRIDRGELGGARFTITIPGKHPS